MLENLSSRLQNIFSGLRSKGKLTEEDVNSAMREIRLALLEADVNYKVAKQFVARTKERALEADVLDSLTPAQNVVKVVLEELTALLGESETKLATSSRIPNVIMLVGLQGSGKTTAASKLAYLLKSQGRNPLLVACDIYRPAAIDQLQTLGSEIDVPVFTEPDTKPVDIALDGIRYAVDNLRDVVIIDTAGRLHIDDEMMAEAAAIKEATEPDNVLMVVDAMTGQDIVNVVEEFSTRVDFDGVIMSKMDGDARGGGALSVREVTGKPIMFISMGEKPNSLEAFHPDRIAKRILGMGDVVSLIENAVRVQQQEDEADALEAERLSSGAITLEDFITINRQLKKMGGVAKIVSALPGGDKMLGAGQIDEGAFDDMEIIINSMTKEERMKPDILNGSRRQRIAEGAGVSVNAVNNMMKKYLETKKMMKKMTANMPTSSRKGKKGKKGKKRRGFGVPGLDGLNLSDLQKFM